MVQLPPRARETARSASAARCVGRCEIDEIDSTRSASAPSAPSALRVSMPSAPCAAHGSMRSGSKTSRMRASAPSRLSPAAARTIASYSPRSTLASRVSRLPRTGTRRRSDRRAASCTTRRRLAVPTTAPAGSASSEGQRLETSASRGSSRSSTAASAKPCGSSIGTSFSECTARSARRSASAVSSSFTKRPLPPTFESVRSRISSPRVVIGTSETAVPKRASSIARTCSACHSASRLSRVAMRSGPIDSS